MLVSDTNFNDRLVMAARIARSVVQQYQLQTDYKQSNIYQHSLSIYRNESI